MQGGACQVVGKYEVFAHITRLLKSLHCLPVENRIDFDVFFIVGPALWDQIPEYLSAIFKQRTTVPSSQWFLETESNALRIELRGSSCPETVECAARISYILLICLRFQKALKTHLNLILN